MLIAYFVLMFFTLVIVVLDGSYIGFTILSSIVLTKNNCYF